MHSHPFSPDTTLSHSFSFSCSVFSNGIGISQSIPFIQIFGVSQIFIPEFQNVLRDLIWVPYDQSCHDSGCPSNAPGFLLVVWSDDKKNDVLLFLLFVVFFLRCFTLSSSEVSFPQRSHDS